MLFKGATSYEKRITILLEIDTDDKLMLSDDFITEDLTQQIAGASNTYEIKSVETEVIVKLN